MTNWISRGLVKHKGGRDFTTSPGRQGSRQVWLPASLLPLFEAAELTKDIHSSLCLLLVSLPSLLVFLELPEGKTSSDQLLAAGQGLQVEQISSSYQALPAGTWSLHFSSQEIQNKKIWSQFSVTQEKQGLGSWGQMKLVLPHCPKPVLPPTELLWCVCPAPSDSWFTQPGKEQETHFDTYLREWDAHGWLTFTSIYLHGKSQAEQELKITVKAPNQAGTSSQAAQTGLLCPGFTCFWHP